jgi:hypothetical protein
MLLENAESDAALSSWQVHARLSAASLNHPLQLAKGISAGLFNEPCV